MEIAMPSYFLIAVSTRFNLDRCIEHRLAGFMDNPSGAWAYVDIADGDYVSLLYGAEVFNLYQVARHFIVANGDTVAPWERLEWAKRPYAFPFRLSLTPVRRFQESLIRREFRYVGEDLFLRGGYRKTQFQADRTTLQEASQLGVPAAQDVASAPLTNQQPRLVVGRRASALPFLVGIDENLIHVLIKRWFMTEANATGFLRGINANHLRASQIEALGERALAEGHVDILVKAREPIGADWKIVLEVKSGTASMADVAQLQGYASQLDPELEGAALVAARFPQTVRDDIRKRGLAAFTYAIPPVPDGGLSVSDCIAGFALTGA